MSENPRIPQRKKRGWYQVVDPPFPVPIASITQVGTSEKNWYYFTGELTAGHVVVRHSGDIHFLHKMGFFGRGLLSQGMPDFYKRLPNVFIPQDNQDPTCYKVARRRMFLRHTQWRKLQGQSQSGEEKDITIDDEEYDSDVEYDYASEMRDAEDYEATDLDDEGKQSHPRHLQDSQTQENLNGSKHMLKQRPEGGINTWTDSTMTEDFWEMPQSEKTHLHTLHNERTNLASHPETSASWDNDDAGDSDFWGCHDSKPITEFLPSENDAKVSLIQASNNTDKNDVKLYVSKVESSQALNNLRSVSSLDNNKDLKHCDVIKEVPPSDTFLRNNSSHQYVNYETPVTIVKTDHLCDHLRNVTPHYRTSQNEIKTDSSSVITGGVMNQSVTQEGDCSSNCQSANNLNKTNAVSDSTDKNNSGAICAFPKTVTDRVKELEVPETVTDRVKELEDHLIDEISENDNMNETNYRGDADMTVVQDETGKEFNKIGVEKGFHESIVEDLEGNHNILKYWDRPEQTV